jgi:MFS family permease
MSIHSREHIKRGKSLNNLNVQNLNADTSPGSPSLRKLASHLGFTTPKSPTSPKKTDDPISPLLVADTKLSTPLPQGPLLAICTVFFTEGFNYTLAFGFVKEMLASIGTPVDQAGYHAGILHAIFTLSQLVSGLIYGITTDQSEKKHIIVILSLLCAMFANIMFGMSSNFYIAALCRLVAGIVNGSVATAKIYITEVTDSTNSMYAYLWFGMSWAAGAFSAPHVGRLFANAHLIAKSPFLAPWLVGATFCILSIIMCLLFMKPKRVLDGTIQEKGLLADVRELWQNMYGGGQYHDLSVAPEMHTSDEI